MLVFDKTIPRASLARIHVSCHTCARINNKYGWKNFSHFFARACGVRTDANKWKLSQPRMKVARQNMCFCFRSWETWLCFWKKLPMCLIFKLYCFPRCSVSSKGDHFLCSFFKNHITEIAQIFFFARASGVCGKVQFNSVAPLNVLFILILSTPDFANLYTNKSAKKSDSLLSWVNRHL